MAKRVARSDAAQRDFQEQKNHQDFVYGTNQTLQDLSNGLKDLTLAIEKLKAKSESDHKTLLIAFENHRGAVTPQCYKADQRVGDLETKLNAHIEMTHAQQRRLNATSVSVRTFEESSEYWSDQIQELHKSLDASCTVYTNSIRYAQNLMDSKIQAVRSELLSLMHQEDPFQAKIEEKIRVFRQDFDSLYKETTNLKLAFGCVQKKFEHAIRVEKQQEVKK